MNDISRLPRANDVAGAAELMMSLLISLSSISVPAGRLRGKTLGLVNTGEDANEIARRANAAFGMPVLFYDEGTASTDRSVRELNDLIESSDFIVIAGSPANEGVPTISAAHLNCMKPDAHFINTGSPGCVDQLALMKALWFETIGGAAFTPGSVPAVLHQQFTDCPNVIFWPSVRADGAAASYVEAGQQNAACPRLVA